VLKLIVNWIMSAVALIVVSHVIRGFDVSSFKSALIAALVIGLVNATLGAFLKLVTFPLTLVTFGVFWFVINAVMLLLVAQFVTGFSISGLLPAFFGAIVLSLVNLVFRMFTKILLKKSEE